MTYLKYELLRAVRNTRFFLFSLGFPLVLFVVVAGPNRHAVLGGIPLPLYYLAGMVSWGTMGAVVSSGARIVAERAAGWNRQLRLTPLSARTYLTAKVVGGYLVAALSIALLYTAGLGLGVRLPTSHWLIMTGLILVGLIPFAAMGIWLGHALTPEAIGPAIGGISSLFALLGGAWGPLVSHGFLLHVAQALPSYWLVQAGRAAATGTGWGAQGWMVTVVWALLFGVLAGRAFRRDTRRL
jgi:ABC-2 type transport system permease protein